MAAVFIDIPGIGNVEAKNAATEATLREILKALQGGARGGGGGAGGGSLASALAGGGGGGGGKAAGGLAGVASKLAKGFLGVAAVAGQVAGAFIRLSESAISVIRQIAGVGDSLTAAAGVFSNIPVVGGILSAAFGAAAESAERLSQAYLSAAASGASFGGSMNQFVASASAAGMEMGKFGQFVRNNSQGLIAFGTSVDGGVSNFVRISRALRSTGSDLYALGYSTEDINKGIANFGMLLRIQGRQGTMSNTQLADASRRYMKEIDALAKATGEERSAIEAKMQQMATDAQFASFMADKDVEVQNSFNRLVTRLGPTLGNFAKDFITTGTLTSEATQQIGAMYGQQALDELQRLRKKALANQQATAEDSDRTVGVMIDQSKRIGKQFGGVMASSGGALDETAKAMIDGNKLQADAMKKAKEDQDNASKGTDGMNQGLQKAKEELAAISNEFTLFLASSGILKDMLSMFKTMVGFVKTYLMPVFSVLSGVIKFVSAAFEPILYGLLLFNPVWRGFVLAFETGKILFDELSIAFGGFGNVLSGLKVVGEKLKEAFTFLMDLFKGAVTGTVRFLIDGLTKIGRTIYDYMYPALQFISRISEEVGKLLKDTFGAAVKWAGEKLNQLGDWFKKIGDEIASWTWVKTIKDTFNSIADSVGNFFRGFNKLAEVSDYLALKWQGLSIAFEKFYLSLDKKITFDKEKLEAIKKREEELGKEEEDRLKKEKELDEKLAANAKKNLADQKADEEKRAEERRKEDKRREDERKKLDKKNADHKRALDAGGATAAADALKKAVECSTMDYNAGPEDLLKAYANKEGSPIAKEVKAKEKAVERASDTEQKKAIIQKAMEDQKAAAERNEAVRKALENNASTPGQSAGVGTTPGQNPNLDSLNALNTHMARLVKQNDKLVELNEKQLSVQRSITGDVYAA